MALNRYRILKELRALAPVWTLGALGILGFALTGYRNYADLHLERKRIPLQIGVWFLMAYSLACWVEVNAGKF